jgi:ketosteroid isomerase-like protein
MLSRLTDPKIYLMKKSIPLVLLLQFATYSFVVGQVSTITEQTKSELISLIDKYSEAREKQDTVLLRSILTEDVDQLVSSGVWRIGIDTAVKGMQQSSATNEGKRTLVVEKYKLLSTETAVLDARYQIEGNDGSVRKMWSTFILVREKQNWKIAGIRNMLPSNQ